MKCTILFFKKNLTFGPFYYNLDNMDTLVTYKMALMG